MLGKGRDAKKFENPCRNICFLYFLISLSRKMLIDENPKGVSQIIGKTPGGTEGQYFLEKIGRWIPYFGFIAFCKQVS
jgi:hypothetical protein